jgi:tetratricopeptide (TPR) repeat protein
MGAPDRAVTSSQRALTHATACGDVTSQVVIRFNLAWAYSTMGDYGRAIDLNRGIAETLTDDVRSGRASGGGFMSVLCRNALAATLAEQGAFTEGLAYGEEGIRLAETSEHPGSLARIYNGVGRLYLCKGALPQAIAMLERAWHFCQVGHITLFSPIIAANLGSAYALCGRVAAALPLLEQAVAQAASMGHMGNQACRVVQLSEGYLLATRTEEAQALAEQALTLARAHQERACQAYALWLLGDIAMRRNPPDPEQAAIHYQHALTLADELGLRPLQAHCHRGRSTLYSQTGKMEQSRAALSTALDMYREMEMTFWLPEMEAMLAEEVGENPTT